MNSNLMLYEAFLSITVLRNIGREQISLPDYRRVIIAAVKKTRG